jgi:hypothetical protein
MEFVEVGRLLQDANVDRITEAGRLAILARDVFKLLVDLGMPPILGIPQDPCTAINILEAVDVILECLRLRPQPLGLGPARLSLSPPSFGLHLYFVLFFLFLDVKIFQRLSVSYVSALSGLSLPSLARQGFELSAVLFRLTRHHPGPIPQSRGHGAQLVT